LERAPFYYYCNDIDIDIDIEMNSEIATERAGSSNEKSLTTSLHVTMR
jgi:hypothetical protein